MPKGVDYSKWDSVELSDDDSDCHPNIEKDFWLRIKKEKREKEKEDHAKEVVALQQQVKAEREQASSLDEQARADGVEDAERDRLQKRAEAARTKASELEAKANKIIEEERKRDWNVQDKFNYAAVNAATNDIYSEIKKSTKGGAAHGGGEGEGAGAAGSGAGGSSSGGQWEVIHAGAPAAAAAEPAPLAAPAAAEPEAEGEEEGEEEAALNAYVAAMEERAQQLGVLGNDEDCFDKSYEVIKKYPEIAVKETTDYLLLVGNDLAKKGEERMGRAFVHQSLMMQYCMDLSVGGANGVLQFFRRMSAPEPKVRERARKHFEAEFEEYWGKVLERARGIRKENERQAKLQEMQEALKPPQAAGADA